jgi:hypothetical protein
MMSDHLRSPDSFGVAGVLSSDCEIFYTNDLRARNIGRVSDLISAQLRGFAADELRIRALLIYGIFQTYALRNLPFQHNEDLPPISVEIGIDAMSIGVAICFHWDAATPPQWDGLVERVESGTAETAFEKTLSWMQNHCHQVLVRYDETERRIEIVSVIDREGVLAGSAIEVIAINPEAAVELPVAKYQELGDLDYSNLLKNPADQEDGAESGTADISETTVTLGSETEPTQDPVALGSSPEEEDQSIKTFEGSKAEEESVKVLAASDKSAAEIEELKKVLASYEKRVVELNGTVSDLESQLEDAVNKASVKRFTQDKAPEKAPVAKSAIPTPEATQGDKDEWGIGLLKQVWPFAKKAEVTPERETTTTFKSDKPESSVDTKVVDEEADLSEEPDSEATIASTKVLAQMEEIAEVKKSKKIEDVLSEIEKDVDGQKAKRWVDSLSSEILQEKAKLSELQKNLSKQIRMREMEFKSAERSLKTELRRKEEMVRQKESAIENKNEQIAQLNLAVERAGSASQDKEQGQMKMKLERAQRTAAMKEEETKVLVTKVRDLENRLIIAQAKAQKGNDLQMQAKVQSLDKKVEEYRRVNQRLMESLNAAKEKTSDKELGDFKRKLEQMERQSIEWKKTAEKSNFKLRELQETERKLQTDLARALEENRNLRKSQTRGSGESGGGQTAA